MGNPSKGNYDADGKADPAVFEEATGNWFAGGSTRGFSTPAFGFGSSTSCITVVSEVT